MTGPMVQQRIRERLEAEVCRACIYRTANGSCGLPEATPCPILSRVDRIIDVVRSVSSDRIEPYIDRLREVVCQHCRFEDENRHCRLRDSADCALDDYFALVVNIVEDELAAAAGPRR